MKKLLIALTLLLSVSAAQAKTMILVNLDPKFPMQTLVLNDNSTFVARMLDEDAVLGEWKTSNGELHLRRSGDKNWVWTAYKSDGKIFSIYDTRKHDFINFRIGYRHD